MISRRLLATMARDTTSHLGEEEEEEKKHPEKLPSSPTGWGRVALYGVGLPSLRGVWRCVCDYKWLLSSFGTFVCCRVN